MFCALSFILYIKNLSFFCYFSFKSNNLTNSGRLSLDLILFNSVRSISCDAVVSISSKLAPPSIIEYKMYRLAFALLFGLVAIDFSMFFTPFGFTGEHVCVPKCLTVTYSSDWFNGNSKIFLQDKLDVHKQIHNFYICLWV